MSPLTQDILRFLSVGMAAYGGYLAGRLSEQLAELTRDTERQIEIPAEQAGELSEWTGPNLSRLLRELADDLDRDALDPFAHAFSASVAREAARRLEHES